MLALLLAGASLLAFHVFLLALDETSATFLRALGGSGPPYDVFQRLLELRWRRPDSKLCRMLLTPQLRWWHLLLPIPPPPPPHRL